MKRKLLSLLAILMMAATGAWADDYTITLPSVSNGSVVAKVSDVSVTSAAAGATVTLEATPDAGYRLKTISTYQGPPEETLSRGEATRTGSYFTLTATYSQGAGWQLYNSNTITITSKDAGRNINQVVLNITPKAKFAFNEMSVDHGTMTISGNVITITGINSNSVVIHGTSSGGVYGCTVTSATITGSGVEKTLTLTATSDANVKTFTMPSGNVTVSAEFELAPINLTANEGATNEYWATFFSNASNYQAPAGTQVFKVTLEGTTIALNEVGDGIINKGQGVLLKSTTGSYALTPCDGESTVDYSDNNLEGTAVSITNPGENDYYVLGKGSNGVGFYKLDATGTIAANKAYLTYSGSLAREFFGFGDATSINSIDNLTIDNLTIYDLQGRRVQNPQRGVYIVNGRKVVIK